MPDILDPAFRAFFNEAADVAREVATSWFRKPLPVHEKDDRSPVTQADREIEAQLRDLISRRFPSHGVVGEEYGAENPDAEYVWVLDPIDGTRAFMMGKPLFGTLIGLMRGGCLLAGLIDQCFTGERWFGIADTEAAHNGTPIRIAEPRPLSQARLYTGSPEMFEGPRFGAWRKLCHKARWQQYGCDCYAYGLLAMGWADLAVECRLKLYDVAALVPIITGAGGFAGNWNLDRITFDFDGTFVAASSRDLAEEAVGVLLS